MNSRANKAVTNPTRRLSLGDGSTLSTRDYPGMADDLALVRLWLEQAYPHFGPHTASSIVRYCVSTIATWVRDQLKEEKERVETHSRQEQADH